MTSEYVVIVNFPIDCSDMTVAELKSEAINRFYLKAYLEHWTVQKIKATHKPEQATIRVDATISASTRPTHSTFNVY